MFIAYDRDCESAVFYEVKCLRHEAFIVLLNNILSMNFKESHQKLVVSEIC